MATELQVFFVLVRVTVSPPLVRALLVRITSILEHPFERSLILCQHHLLFNLDEQGVWQQHCR